MGKRGQGERNLEGNSTTKDSELLHSWKKTEKKKKEKKGMEGYHDHSILTRTKCCKFHMQRLKMWAIPTPNATYPIDIVLEDLKKQEALLLPSL